MGAGRSALASTKKFTYPLDGKFGQGAIQIDPTTNRAWLAALADPSNTLPDGDVPLVGAELSVAPGRDITVGPAKVGFSADVNAALGVYSTPATVRQAALKNADLVSQVADALAFTGEAGDKFLLLRWGYDIEGTAAGSVALAPSANLSFSANAARKGYYAIVQTVPGDSKAVSSLENLIASWKLASQVDDITKMSSFTTVISEVDGSFAAGAKVTLGYDFSWLHAVNGLGLKGDIGLKLKTGLSASVGIGMSGKYALVLSRETAARTIHMRLYKLKVNDWNFGFSASLTATPVTPPLPQNFDDLLKAVTGTHGQQIVNLLGRVEDWVDPNRPIFGPFVNLADSEAQKLVQMITGVTDLAGGFGKIKTRLQNAFQFWTKLPQTATQLIWSKLPDPEEIKKVADIAKLVSGATLDGLTKFVESKLVDVAFLNTTAGKALESLAANGLFSTLQDTKALTDVQDAAKLVGNILDGSELQSLFTKLQSAVDTKLDLTKLQSVVDQSSFDSLDTWLKARLEDFLGHDLVGAQGLAELAKVRDGLKAILAKKDELYAKALAALKRNYEITFNATYQSTTTTSALLDATFDFDAAGSQAGQGLRLALAGQFDQLLAQAPTGVTIKHGVLAFGLPKESHILLALPFFSTESIHVNDAVAQLQTGTVTEDAGALYFSLTATDIYTVKNDFSSALTIALNVPASGQKSVRVHSDTAAYRYVLKEGIRGLNARALSLQYAPYANAYFAHEFKPAAPGTFADWAKQIAPAGGFFGNTLISLDVLGLSP
jgi:hypothetical protein